jgi:glycosyltransferase involved in cell wall biosynthesis
MSAHLVLPTYELHPINAGGAGVFVAGAVRMLARAGFRVTVLCDFPDYELSLAQRMFASEELGPGSVNAVGVPALLREPDVFQPPPGSHWEQKSAGFAEALRRLLARDPADLIEFPEYGGASLATLQARAAHGFPQVPVVLRLHGGLEFIDRAEGVVAEAERLRMYAAEAKGMLLADRLLAPSAAMGRMYQERYGFPAERVVVSPPPMEVLLDGVQRAERFVDPAHFLFYGKLQEVKGCDVLAEAAVRILRQDRRRWRFSFVGRDTPCTRHGMMVSECLARIIPADAPFEAFEFIPGIDRAQLSRLARTPRAAIVPSRFETFCLAAHELRATGMPLIVPRIPAFVDWLSEDTGCLTFDGSVEGLMTAILSMRNEDDLAQRLEQQPPPYYPPFAEAYLRMVPELAKPVLRARVAG